MSQTCLCLVRQKTRESHLVFEQSPSPFSQISYIPSTWLSQVIMLADSHTSGLAMLADSHTSGLTTHTAFAQGCF